MILDNYRWVRPTEPVSAPCALRLDSLIRNVPQTSFAERIWVRNLMDAIVSESAERIVREVGTMTIADCRKAQIEEDTRHLLEMEMAKIQREYISIEIWFAILTVVFLIFSFYSLFKADDLVKQQKKAVSELDRLQERVSDNVEQQQDRAQKNIDRIIEGFEQHRKDLEARGWSQMRRIKDDFAIEQGRFKQEHSDWAAQGSRIMKKIDNMHEDFQKNLTGIITDAKKFTDTNLEASRIDVDRMKTEYTTIRSQVDKLRQELKDLEQRMQQMRQNPQDVEVGKEDNESKEAKEEAKDE